MEPTIEQKIRTYRRHFHINPELAWLEYSTATFIADELMTLGFEVKRAQELMDAKNLMGLPNKAANDLAYEKAVRTYSIKKVESFAHNCTAVAGVLDCGEGPCVALRFDMDALPISESDETNHLPYQKGFVSKNEGVMHSCGHDAHMAIGLGLAHCLSENKESLRGRIILLFQPAEEGVRGADPIVNSGFLKSVDYLLAAHLWSNMPLGKIVCSQNGTMATDKLDITFYGKSAHAGICPEEGNNAILAAANTILELNEIQFKGQDLRRVNVGCIEGGTARNIIADNASLKVELRAKSQAVENELLSELEQIVKHSALKQSCTYKIEKVGAASAARGDDSLAHLIEEEARQMNCFDELVLSDCVNRGSEDFTSLMSDVQSRGAKACFIGVGASLPEKKLQHHTPTFDINEDAMFLASELFFRMVQRLNRRH